MARNLLIRPEAGHAALERHLARMTGHDSAPIRHAALVLEKTWKLVLSKPGSGREYARGKKTHVASAPGEPPAVDTGRLRNSISHGTVGGVMRVGTGVIYARALEYGHKYKNRTLLPRPHARPALIAARQEMHFVVVSSLKTELKKDLARGA